MWQKDCLEDSILRILQEEVHEDWRKGSVTPEETVWKRLKKEGGLQRSEFTVEMLNWVGLLNCDSLLEYECLGNVDLGQLGQMAAISEDWKFNLSVSDFGGQKVGIRLEGVQAGFGAWVREIRGFGC